MIDRHLDAKKNTPWMLREVIIYLLFYLLLGFPTVNFGPLSRWQPL